MAYNTKYELTVVNADRDAVLAELQKLADCEVYPLAGSKALHCGPGPWYDHDEHMQQLAARFPDAVFCLRGFGAESGDIWRKFYRHGYEHAEQRARLVYDLPPEWAWIQGLMKPGEG